MEIPIPPPSPEAEESQFTSPESEARRGKIREAIGWVASKFSTSRGEAAAQDEAWGDIVDIANRSRERGEPGLPFEEGPDIRHISLGHTFDKLEK